MSLYGKNRTTNTMIERKKKLRNFASVQKSFSICSEVAIALDKEDKLIRFRYGSISQYVNYLLAKDLGLIKDEEEKSK